MGATRVPSGTNHLARRGCKTNRTSLHTLEEISLQTDISNGAEGAVGLDDAVSYTSLQYLTRNRIHLDLAV